LRSAGGKGYRGALVEERSRHTFAAPFQVGGDRAPRVCARIGVARYPRGGADAETLYRNSEAALKEAVREARVALPSRD